MNSHFKCLTKNNNFRRFRTKSKVNRERTVKEMIDNSRYWLYSIMVYVLIFFSQHFSGSDLIEKKLNKRLSLVLTSQSLLAINYWSYFKVGKGIIGSMRQGKGRLQKKKCNKCYIGSAPPPSPPNVTKNTCIFFKETIPLLGHFCKRKFFCPPERSKHL